MIKWSDYFYYDETSPTYLRHKINKYGGRKMSTVVAAKDSVAGNIRPDGYINVKLNTKSYKVGRVILLLFGNTIKEGFVVDHIDGNRSNNRIDNLRIVPPVKNTRNKKMRNTNISGVAGVSVMSNGQGAWYCSANWNTLEGKHTNKRFSVNKLGIMVAFRDAVAYREKMIKELNEQGAGYTERHGK